MQSISLECDGVEHIYYAELDSLCIRPLARRDLEHLRNWRNDKQVSRFFRKIDYITSIQQQQWFHQYLREPNIFYWAIVEEDKEIGSLSLYDVEELSGEIGKFMIGDKMSRGKGYGYKSFIMTLKVGFEKLQLEKIRVTVHEKNIPAKRIYDRVGFSVTGRHPFDNEGDELEMVINKKTFKEVNPMEELVILGKWGYCWINKSPLPSVFNYKRLEVA